MPFFPQTDYQCGPAALATLLASSGAAVDADDLVREVYVEGLHGSLQPELLGATRRHGFVPYVIAPDASALLAELSARRPVLVLQNLGVARVPVWHYAVVVGVAEGGVILRSGTQERRVERGTGFLRSWQRGANWAFVALEPGEMPATATAGAYIRALAGAEPLLDAVAAERGYRAALARWPSDELVLFAAAGQRYAAGDLAGATTLYRQLLAAAPQHAAARNNLANVLGARGCHAEALAEARSALAAVAPTDELGAAVRDTVAELERAAAAGAPQASCQ
ncbi:MAG TPA: PA2778 family cysteine peptidase [Gammaproteobacteria bacterium]|nr:PA2778 family cysteine peptidase [Gammaproteobacteria bacterium]